MTATAPLGRALAYAGATHTMADLETGIAEGRFQRWDGEASTIITEVLSTPRRKTLHFFLAEGHMGEIQAMVPGILEWGHSIRCTHASLVGREGWRRVKWMLDSGWRFEQIVMGKEL